MASLWISNVSVPVLKVVGHLDRFGRQFSRLADWHKACPQLASQCGSKDEAPRLDSYNQINLLRSIVRAEFIQHILQSLCILQQRSDVVKEDAFLWKIRNAADELLEFVHSNLTML